MEINKFVFFFSVPNVILFMSFFTRSKCITWTIEWQFIQLMLFYLIMAPTKIRGVARNWDSLTCFLDFSGPISYINP